MNPNRCGERAALLDILDFSVVSVSFGGWKVENCPELIFAGIASVA